MVEYIFFDAGLRDQFVAYAHQLGITCELHDDPMGMVVALPEDLADDLMEQLEERYDQLQDEQSDLIDEEEGGQKKLAGFRLDLPDGRSCLVPLPPETANRLLAHFSFDEIHELFSLVARSALNPEENTRLCQIMKAANSEED